MRAYIQTDETGNFYNVNAYVADEGFRNFGFECLRFNRLEEIADGDPEAVLVGGIANVRGRLEQLGFRLPGHEIEYPDALTPFCGRRIWSTTLKELARNSKDWNVFVKPKETKRFTGKVILEQSDFIGLPHAEEGVEVWCSEIVDFRAEWRCFVRYGEVLDARRYTGEYGLAPDKNVILDAVAAWKEAPAAYALDVGLTADGRTLLVEVNDGHSLGSYGLGSAAYARFLSARWAQMTHTQDYLRF